MLEDAITKEGLLKPEILSELYDEALELSNSIVQYLGTSKKDSLNSIDSNYMGFYTLECNRMTTGIMQAMSWCLMQKGVSNGEITVAEASEKKNRLSNNQLFDVPVGCDLDKFPNKFREYSDRVRTLYAKIIRVDRLLYEGGFVEDNPVHNLIEKIENNS